MKVAFDLDGTLDSNEGIRDLMKKLHKAGHKTVVLTGSHVFPVTDIEKAEKRAKLSGLGLGGDYDKLKVYPNPPGNAKAAYCAKHNVSLMIDNSLSNAQLAPAGTTVLVPWRTITP